MMRAITSSACRAPNSVRAASRVFCHQLRMRGGQKAPGLLAILPDVFGRGDHPRQSLGPFAFRRAQTFPRRLYVASGTIWRIMAR